MAGHSKWANIQHRKNRQDERKGRAFGKLIKEITVAAKLGGDDVTTNPRLRLAIEKAKEANLPKDKVKDAINRGCGSVEGVTYDEMTYEGYGAGGVAFLINCLTDNRSRTVAEIRHAFNKHNGNLGTEGSVSYLFDHCCQFFLNESKDKEEDLLELLIEKGISEVKPLQDIGIELVGEADAYTDIKETLLISGYKIEFSEVVMLAKVPVSVRAEDLANVEKLKIVLESLDDVQNVFTNADI